VDLDYQDISLTILILNNILINIKWDTGIKRNNQYKNRNNSWNI
jgi:hypothetical protein